MRRVITRRRRLRIGLLVFVLLTVLIALGGFGASQFPDAFGKASEKPPERADTTPTVEQPDKTEAANPEDPTLYLTVPRLGLYDNTVRNDDSELALGLGAVKLPETSFPWQKGDTNTYIACHRLGFPGTESHNQCLDLPSMQKGDEVVLKDTNGTVYRYRVSEILTVSPNEMWVTDPVAGREMVSLQTCIESPGDFSTLGPNWTARFIVRADRVG